MPAASSFFLLEISATYRADSRKQKKLDRGARTKSVMRAELD
jgi:hypothetical protein